MAASFAEAREALRDYRETNARESRRIAQLCNFVLKSHASALGNEIWVRTRPAAMGWWPASVDLHSVGQVVYEQAFLAALDIGDDALLALAKAKLQARFGAESARVQRLAGLAAEADAKSVQSCHVLPVRRSCRTFLAVPA